MGKNKYVKMIKVSRLYPKFQSYVGKDVGKASQRMCRAEQKNACAWIPVAPHVKEGKGLEGTSWVKGTRKSKGMLGHLCRTKESFLEASVLET